MDNTGLNQSFSRRVGKGLSIAQRRLIESNLPLFKFKPETIKPGRQIYLEIGFGNGEHLINQALKNPQALFIGAEAYLNGVANAVKLIIEHELKNIVIWPDDIDLILKQIPVDAIDGIYLLFPDPWPKSSQRKRRILNLERLKMIDKILKNGGFCAFASDISDYYSPSLRLFEQLDYHLASSTPHENYIQTKYHNKAILEGRTAQFFTVIKK